MQLSIIQIIFSFFILFAISRVFLQFRGGALSLVGFFFWVGLFSIALIAIVSPQLTSEIAKFIGIGRGVDVALYASVVLLFYLVFRIYVFLEDIKHDITDLVKELSLKEIDKKNEKKTTKN